MHDVLALGDWYVTGTFNNGTCGSVLQWHNYHSRHATLVTSNLTIWHADAAALYMMTQHEQARLP
jgi:hypothetical protein